ncbi:MAG: hypothetical protein K0S80_3747 [Neobacillus sp.]|nr:hypothetical protein [Neobacillus sp.]
MKSIDNWEIQDVYQRLPLLANQYLIKLYHKNPKESIPDYEEIIIQSSKFYDELLKLKQGKTDRIYFAYGMADIDFWTSNGDYIITYSPMTCVNIYFKLSQDEYEKLLVATKPAKEATQ